MSVFKLQRGESGESFKSQEQAAPGAVRHQQEVAHGGQEEEEGEEEVVGWRGLGRLTATVGQQRAASTALWSLLRPPSRIIVVRVNITMALLSAAPPAEANQSSGHSAPTPVLLCPPLSCAAASPCHVGCFLVWFLFGLASSSS